MEGADGLCSRLPGSGGTIPDGAQECVSTANRSGSWKQDLKDVVSLLSPTKWGLFVPRVSALLDHVPSLAHDFERTESVSFDAHQACYAGIGLR